MSNAVHTFYLPESVSELYTDYDADTLSYMWLISVTMSSSECRVFKFFFF